MAEKLLEEYQQTGWSPGMAITANRMMKIETELTNIVTAVNKLHTDDATLQTNIDSKASASGLSAAQTDIDTIETVLGMEDSTTLDNNKSISFIGPEATTVIQQLNNTIRAMADMIQSSGHGDKAYNEMVLAGIFNAQGGVEDSLASKFYTLTSDINDIQEALGKNNGEDIYTAEHPVADSIAEIRETSNKAWGAIDGVPNAEYKRQYGDNAFIETIRAMQTKLNSIDMTQYAGRFTTFANRLQYMNDEIDNAKVSSNWANADALDWANENNDTERTFLTVDARLEELEKFILDSTSGLSSKVRNLGPVDVLNSNDTTKALSAKQGKVLKEAVDAINTKLGSAITNDNTVTKALNDITNAFGQAYDSTNTIHDAISTAQTNATNAAIAATIEKSKIINTFNNWTNEPNGTIVPNYRVMSAALGKTLRDDIDTIANELSMYNQAGAISDANTRIDTIEKNVLEMGKEIGMISDLSTVQNLSDTVVRNDTDIDKLKAQIAGARIQTGTDAQGNPTYQYADLDGRFDTVEGLLNNSTTGVAPRVTALEADMEAAEGKIEVLEGTTAMSAVKYGDIINNIDTPNDASHANKVLDARQGVTIKAIKTEVEGAHRTLASGVADTLDNRFDDIESRATTVENTVNNPTTGVSMLNTRVGTLESSLSGYTGANAVSSKFSSVDTEIGTIKSTINMNEFGTTAGNTVADKLNTKVAKADIYNDLNYVPEANSAVTSHKVLDAAQGKVLNDAINALDGRLDTVEDEISDAHRANVNNDTLDNRFDDIESDTDSLGRRLNTVEANLLAARNQTGTDDQTNEPIYQFTDLDNRFDNIEGIATQLRTDVNEIATELSMLDNNTIAGTQSRIDNIETVIDHVQGENDEVPNGLTQRITALETTINAQDDGLSDRMSDAEERLDALDDESTGAIAGLDERISSLETAIDHVQDQDDEVPNGLTQRIESLENDVNNVTTGLAATYNRTTTNLSNISSLTTRVSTLESQPKSATVIYSESQITYDNNGNPTIYENSNKTQGTEIEPTQDIDYLLEKIENNESKYYYWKYIGTYPNGTWAQISGEGGSGNSNAEDYLTYAAFELAAKEENKDYYVLQNDNIRHHYRYLKTLDTNQEEVWTRIEIGVPTSIIKSYQIARYSDENTNNEYLDLYRFDFDVDVDPDDVDTVQNYANYRIARVELPKGGGGEGSSSGHKVYAKVRGNQSERISWSSAKNNGIYINYGVMCYAKNELNEYDYLPLQATLSINNTDIKTYNVGSLEYANYTSGAANITTDNLLNYCIKNDTVTFTLTVHATNTGAETVADKIITVSITLVDLSLTSSFTDQRTYSINNNLSIPYEFIGMSDTAPTFEVLLDGSTLNATITSTNIVIRKEQLTNKKGIHNLSIRAGQFVGGSMLYSDPLLYQLGLIDGLTDNVMLISGVSLDPNLINEQYQIKKLPYYLYVPSGETAIVSYLAERLTYNEQQVITGRETVAELYRASESLSTGAYIYNFRIHEMVADIEYYAITISCSGQSLVFYIKVNKAAEQINIVTNNLMFDFKPERYSNNVDDDSLRLWSDTNNGITYKMRIPDGAHFDWRTGGWMTVDDVPCFCVKAGSRVEFIQEINGVESPLTLFWDGMETQGGSDFKCTFKIDNVKTPNTPFLTSLDEDTNTIINYGKSILSSKQDVEDDETVLSSYLNVKYIETITKNGSKDIKTAIGVTTLDNSPFDTEVTAALAVEAQNSAASKNTKKIKQYITNIYNMANSAANQMQREYLLRLLSNKTSEDPIDYTLDDKGVTQINNDIITYLMTGTNAETIYNQLVDEGSDSSTITYAYRQAEPINFDAMLNGFVVEGKAGKDGIIAMLQFTFVSTVKTSTDGTYSQTVSANPISTNSFANTGTFRVIRTQILTQEEINEGITPETQIYEVEMLDEEGNGTYTEIVSIRDASNTETRAYGLELNALGSNIYLPTGIVSYAHSEGDIIEFEYNINPPISGRINSSIIIYEDGVPSAAKLYTTNNNTFEQNHPGCLTIGSDECDVYIYKMRLYSQALSNENILANFYADGLTTDDMMNRYNRNKILVNAQTITPQLIATECPDLRVIMIEAPNLTGGKTSFIKNTKVRQIYKNGRPEDNWVALNAYHAGQGTSSDNYGAAGRNLDIMFGFDGIDTVIIPKPQKNNYIFDPNYKSILIKGLNEDLTNNILTAEEYENAGYTVEYNGSGKVSFTPESVPNNWFNIKVNIASSENTNNAFLQKRFDRYLPYETPAMKRDNKIKNDMEFFNCVIFIKETGTPSEFTEDKDIAAENRPWHFYGIGNIGDSKKTDKTRVNVEDDPYEFCIEISDNGLKNSGFCSGVFYISDQSKTNSQTTNPDLAITHSATNFVVLENAQYTESGNGYTFSIGEEPDVNTIYAVPIVTNKFTYYRRFMFISNNWTEIGEPITFTRTTYGIKYPISSAEWTSSLNEYHKALYDTTSGKGWDKSFEFRYDITTKDGETVARNDLEAAMNELHQQTNKKAFADMYTWIVTATDEEFQDEFNIRAVNPTSTWFIKESPLYWYLFTERYTMIDSRAKNTFYHFGKVYITQDEYDGITKTSYENANAAAYALEHDIQDVKDKNNNIIVSKEDIAAEEIAFRLAAETFIYRNRDTFIVNNTLADANHNNGYRFDLWDYDNDTALGINNNGQMVFSAGLEDIDKDVSGWIYNEAESVIWRRIRENSYDDLSALYVQRKDQCFNAENLIQEFDTSQAQFPEELWRLDFERKYYRPFISKGETTYLNDMANGRKRYQRRQFERNMAIYINSKYQRNGSYNENDLISFRPQFTWTAGRDTRITVKPYSTMYINFMMGNDDNTGNDTLVSTRVKRGDAYIIDPVQLGIHDFNNIQCIIYNASRIMELDGLGNFECKQFILGSAKKLSVLKLGSTDYVNRSMENINNMGLSDGLPLLEELDLTNIQFGRAPDIFTLDNFPLLKKLNATGCNIRSFTFKDGGMLENIIFPAILTKIEFKNLYNLKDTLNNENQIVPAVTLTGAANLISYISENSYNHSYNIVQNMLNNAGINGITKLILNDIDWTIGDLSDLATIIQLKERLGSNMDLRGTIHVTGNYSNIKKQNYDTIIGTNHIIWDISNATQIAEYELRFYLSTDDVVNNREPYFKKYVTASQGSSQIVLGPDPITEGECLPPTKESTVSTNYYFGISHTYYEWDGWRFRTSNNTPTNNTVVDSNTDLIAIFSEEARTYPLKWYLHEPDNNGNVSEQDWIRTVSGIPYGSSYEGIAPTILDLKKDNKNTATFSSTDGINATYSIFEGWQKNPINLDETFLNADGTEFHIYGSWRTGTGTINELRTQTQDLPLRLLALTNSENPQTVFDRNSTITLNMGYDNNKGTTIIGKNASIDFGSGAAQTRYTDTNVLRFSFRENLDGSITMNPSIRSATSIKPFEHMQTQGFTLAIDYQVDTDYIKTKYNNGYVILSGAYYNNSGSTQGMALYYDIVNDVVKVAFGDVSATTTFTNSTRSCAITNPGNISGRNIVVIRHEPNTNYLNIYSGIKAESGIILSLTDNNFQQRITWSNNEANAPLCFGHFTTNTVSESRIIPGIGTTIYWAKYWDEDLGKDECIRLAAWPHEELTFALEDYTADNGNTTEILKTSSKNMIFSALQLSQYTNACYLPNSIASGTGITYGFELTSGSINTLYKQIANERFYLGLPIEIQSIIQVTAGKTSRVEIQKPVSGNAYYQYDRTEDTYDLAFIPTYIESGGSTTGYQDNEAYAPFTWYKSTNTTVFTYNNSFDFTTSTLNQNYMNLRFLGVPIKTGGNIIYDNYNGTNTAYSVIQTQEHNINNGDILILVTTNEETIIRTAYIYVNAEGVAKGAPIVRPEVNAILDCNGNGGWVKAGSWWTRTLMGITPEQAQESSAPTSVRARTTTSPFYYVQSSSGAISTNPTGNNAYFVYEFGI